MPQTNHVQPVSPPAIRLCPTVTFVLTVVGSPRGLSYYFLSYPGSAYSTLPQQPLFCPLHSVSFLPLPFLLSGSLSHSPLSSPHHSFLHLPVSPQSKGFPRAPNERLLRSRWRVPRVSPLGVGHPTVSRLSTPSRRIWCIPTCWLEEPDTGPRRVRSPRQLLGFSEVGLPTDGTFLPRGQVTGNVNASSSRSTRRSKLQEVADISARGTSSPQ